MPSRLEKIPSILAVPTNCATFITLSDFLLSWCFLLKNSARKQGGLIELSEAKYYNQRLKRLIEMSLLETKNVYLFIPNLIGELSGENCRIA